MKYAEILVDVANRRLDQSYHYLIPDDLEIKVGMTVIVTLKHRKVQGLVVKITEERPAIEEVKLKPIDSVLEENCLIPRELIDLTVWLAETTICSVAQALHTVWPFLKGKAEQWITPAVKMDDEDVKVLKLLDPETYAVLATLHRSRRKGLAESALRKRTKVQDSLLEDMIKQGWIKKELKFLREGTIKTSTGKSDRIRATTGREPDQVFWPTEEWIKSGGNLSPEQKKVALSIWGAYEKKDGGTVLLYGVTGSGKTEVYKNIVAKVLHDGGDAIILVPEISLTSQIAKVFKDTFGEAVDIIHSGISSGEKLAVWERILAGEKRIIIGARSAVFAPLPNLSLIILDEEHDNAYKQDENPKYHARDVARRRMMQRQGLVILGSATPSLEAYAASQRGIISLYCLKERFNQRSLPSVEIVDMKQELANGNKSMFSLALRAKLQDRLAKGEQSILFLNRRGYSTFVFCRECGFVARCPHCDVALTFHSQKQELCCHYCNYQQEVFHRCPDCGSRYIRFFGQGTQKVEEEVAALFPGVEVLRLDTDTTSEAGKHMAILDKFRKENVPVLVGTQMLAKGLDFPNVTLVGVISADQLLNMPDFRSRERAFQLLTQVAGRAGRGTIPGDVVFQTYSPQDRAILRAAKQDFQAFFWEEIAYRKKLSYPPFSHIIRIVVFQDKEDKVIKAAHDLTDCIRAVMAAGKEPDYQILGPAPAILPKLKNEFRWQVSVKGKNPEVLRRTVYAGVQAFYQGTASSGIKISIEVNPLTSL